MDTRWRSIFRERSSYGGTDAPAGAYIGSNGLTIDHKGRLTIRRDRQSPRHRDWNPDGTTTVLADRYQGKRLNSPNDLVYKSDGSLYFTDPPHGLPKEDQDPKKELAFNGIYRVKGRELQSSFKEANSRARTEIAFSPDEKFLYVPIPTVAEKIWMRFEIRLDGTLERGSVFYDATAETAEGLPDAHESG